jgi:hypothetical protein
MYPHIHKYISPVQYISMPTMRQSTLYKPSTPPGQFAGGFLSRLRQNHSEGVLLSFRSTLPFLTPGAVTCTFWMRSPSIFPGSDSPVLVDAVSCPFVGPVSSLVLWSSRCCQMALFSRIRSSPWDIPGKKRVPISQRGSAKRLMKPSWPFARWACIASGEEGRGEVSRDEIAREEISASWAASSRWRKVVQSVEMSNGRACRQYDNLGRGGPSWIYLPPSLDIDIL